MKKFKVTVTKTSEFEIEIDDNIWTQEEIENWAKSLYPADGPQDIAEHLATSISNYGTGQSMEGFGNVKGFYSYNEEIYHKAGTEFTSGLAYKVGILDDVEIESEEIE